MIRKKQKILSILIVLCIIGASSPLLFKAGTSPSTRVKVYGITYDISSYVGLSNGAYYAQAQACSLQSSVPIGYMGCKARLYNSNGTLLVASGWVYNNSTFRSHFATANGTAKMAGPCYAYGSVRFYNGNGYTEWYTNKTPMLPRSVQLLNINENGETYGIGSMGEGMEDPDLILARGIDGTLGYVKALELNYDIIPNSPEEAAQISNEPRSIPLYESDGITIIGTFIVE